MKHLTSNTTFNNLFSQFNDISDSEEENNIIIKKTEKKTINNNIGNIINIQMMNELPKNTNTTKYVPTGASNNVFNNTYNVHVGPFKDKATGIHRNSDGYKNVATKKTTFSTNQNQNQNQNQWKNNKNDNYQKTSTTTYNNKRPINNNINSENYKINSENYKKLGKNKSDLEGFMISLAAKEKIDIEGQSEILKLYKNWDKEDQFKFWGYVLSFQLPAVFECNKVTTEFLAVANAPVKGNTNGFSFYNWVLWPYKVTNYNIENQIKMLKLMKKYEISPFDKNKSGETAMKLLKHSINLKYIPEKYERDIYNEILTEPGNSLNKIITSTLNKYDDKIEILKNEKESFTEFTIRKEGHEIMEANRKKEMDGLICWIAMNDIQAMAERLCTKTLASLPQSANHNCQGLYPVIRSRCSFLMKILKNGPKIGSEFDDFFREHPWNSEYYLKKFKGYMYDVCTNEQFSMINEDIRAAALGEICDENKLEEYMLQQIKNDNYRLLNVCMAHSSFVNDKIYDQIYEKRDNIENGYKVWLSINLNKILTNKTNLSWLDLKDNKDKSEHGAIKRTIREDYIKVELLVDDNLNDCYILDEIDEANIEKANSMTKFVKHMMKTNIDDEDNFEVLKIFKNISSIFYILLQSIIEPQKDEKLKIFWEKIKKLLEDGVILQIDFVNAINKIKELNNKNALKEYAIDNPNFEKYVETYINTDLVDNKS